MSGNNVCISCKAPEAPDRKGASYEAKSESGQVIKFWLCNRCAFPLGPQQGPIDLDDPRAKV